MSSKSQYRPAPQQPVAVDPALQAQINARLMDMMFGSANGAEVERPATCGSCAYCNGTEDGIRCFALPPKVVWVHEDDGEGGRVFNSTHIRPAVNLGDHGCSLGVCRK